MDMIVVQNELTTIALAEHAAVIRALGKRVIRDIVEIGARLTEAKKLAGHGNWLPWLEEEFGWSEQTALNFMRVTEMAAKSKTVLDLDIPMRGLYLLAAPSTPEEARAEVIERAEAGETMTVADVQHIVDDALVKQADENAARLRQEIKRREAEIRAEYASQLLVSPERLQAEIQKAVDKAVAPLELELRKAEKRLEAANKQLADQRPVEQATGPKIDSNTSLASTGIQMAISTLASKLTITPQQMIEVETLIASKTNQDVSQRLGKAEHDALVVVDWIDQFVSRSWK